tara:strand:- start:1920 stop:2147 length:228 start_codon:yes stop_codon:yes gene_type:complete
MIAIIEDLMGITDIIIGDLNFDGVINVLDIVNLVNIILGVTINPPDDVLYAADMNQDGTIDVLDIVLTVNLVLNP